MTAKKDIYEMLEDISANPVDERDRKELGWTFTDKFLALRVNSVIVAMFNNIADAFAFQRNQVVQDAIKASPALPLETESGWYGRWIKYNMAVEVLERHYETSSMYDESEFNLDGWFAVSTADGGYIAYFKDETAACSFRLMKINQYFNH